VPSISTAKLVAVVLLAGTPVFGVSGASAQNQVEIDHSSGRVVIQDEWRGFGHQYTVDHERRVLYTVDAEEPFSVTTLSLVNGAVQVGVFGGEGEGPGEFRVIEDLAVAPEGLFVADPALHRVSHWDPDGNFQWTWSPPAAPANHVSANYLNHLCVLGGQPAVPKPEGIRWRTEDGGVTLLAGTGDAAANLLELAALDPSPSENQVLRTLMDLSNSKIACIGNTAYVQRRNRLFGYTTDGRSFEVPIPAILADMVQNQQEGVREGVSFDWYTDLSHDGAGNLVLTKWPRRVAGAIVAPETGCYTIVLDNKSVRVVRDFLAVHRDSALVSYRHREERVVDGKRVQVSMPTSYMVALRPLRQFGEKKGCDR